MIASAPLTQKTPFITEKQRFFSHHALLRQRFGYRTYRVTIDAGFTCPNRDGNITVGGCTYCNNSGFSPASRNYRSKPHLEPRAPVAQQIDENLPYLRSRYKADKFIAYFQAYSSTYAELDDLKRLYEPALQHDAESRWIHSGSMERAYCKFCRVCACAGFSSNARRYANIAGPNRSACNAAFPRFK